MRIQITDLCFHYEGSHDDIFSHASVQLDSDWKLGFIARNGRGKTTLLRILAGQLPYAGLVDSPLSFSLFPQEVADENASAFAAALSLIGPYAELEREMAQSEHDPKRSAEYLSALERYGELDGWNIAARLRAEAGRLGVPEEALERPYATLSPGERSKLQLAALFLRPNNFLLIDEPTNHLDLEARERLAQYLNTKKSYLLVSHDRSLLDGCIDHVLTIERDRSLRVERGSYTSWQKNVDARNEGEIEENERLRGEIRRLRQSAREKSDWSDKLEKGKIGGHVYDRGAVGAQAARTMKRAKALERRIDRAAEEKSRLLHNIEETGELKLFPLEHPARRLFRLEDVTIDYGRRPLFSPVSYDFQQGTRLWIRGGNGSGKSSLLRLLLGQDVPHAGGLYPASNLIVSYVPQETGFLSGSASQLAASLSIDRSQYFTILRKLGFEREQFEKDLADFSMGQKKKALLAASLCQRAQLYLWDEPLNYVDLLSRVQLEQLILRFKPSMVLIEHDKSFAQNVATDTLILRAP